MALITHIAGADVFRRTPALSLTEDEYMRKYYSPEAERIDRESIGEFGAAKRGAIKAQKQIADAQLGGGYGAESTSLGEDVVTGMDPTFKRLFRRKAMLGRLAKARARQRIAARRETERAGALATASGVASAESAALSAIPFAGPYMSAATGLVGSVMQPALAERSKPGTYQPSEGIGTDIQANYGNEGRGIRQGGGGLYDLYNLAY